MFLTALQEGVTSREPATVTDPMSRHNLHVTDRSDLIDIGPWSQDQLFAAVERADSEDGAIVLDYDREQLYLADTDDLAYLPPTALGIADDPGLRIDQPRAYDPESRSVGRVRVESVTVSPEFDILIPAFDWTEPDDEWEPPELDYRDRPSGSPSGAVGG